MGMNLKIVVILIAALNLALITEGKRRHIEIPAIPEKDDQTMDSILSAAAANAKAMEHRMMMEDELNFEEDNNLDSKLKPQDGMGMRHGVYSGNSVIFVDSEESAKKSQEVAKKAPAAKPNMESRPGLNMIKSESTDGGMIYYFDKTEERLKDPIVHTASIPVAAIIHRPPPRMDNGDEVKEISLADALKGKVVVTTPQPELTNKKSAFSKNVKSSAHVPSPSKPHPKAPAPPKSSSSKPKANAAHAPPVKTSHSSNPSQLKKHEKTHAGASSRGLQGRFFPKEDHHQIKTKKECLPNGESCRRHGECCQNYCNWYSMKCTYFKKAYNWN